MKEYLELVIDRSVVDAIVADSVRSSEQLHTSV